MIRSRFGQVVIYGPGRCKFALSTFVGLPESIQRQDISDIGVIRLKISISKALSAITQKNKAYSPAEHWNRAPVEGYRVQLPR